MGPGLLSAALLLAGSSLLFPGRFSLSEEGRRRPSWEQEAGPGGPEALRGQLRRQRGPDAPEKRGTHAKGSICSFLSAGRSLPCLFPTSTAFAFGPSFPVFHMPLTKQCTDLSRTTAATPVAAAAAANMAPVCVGRLWVRREAGWGSACPLPRLIIHWDSEFT